MDDLDDIKESEFVTDTDDQDSLDEKIDLEQRIRNQQLWASFQNAACCITKLYRDRTQQSVSPWVPFQNAASNLTTLYKDCIESQRRFAKVGYQVGRRKRLKELKKLLKKHQAQTKSANVQLDGNISALNNVLFESSQAASSNAQHAKRIQQQNTVSSILAVNQLNLDCDETSHQMEEKDLFNDQQQYRSFQSISEQQTQQQQQQQLHHDPTQLHHNIGINNLVSHQNSHQQHQQNPSVPTFPGNNEEDLVTFQQALVQPATTRAIKLGHNTRRPSFNTAQAGYINNRSIEATKSEEDRLLELNQFLSEEYHRHVGSRKRSCASIGGNVIKRARE